MHLGFGCTWYKGALRVRGSALRITVHIGLGYIKDEGALRVEIFLDRPLRHFWVVHLSNLESNYV